MRIDKLDENFKKEEVNTEDGRACYNIPNEKFDLYGVYYDEEEQLFLRMDLTVPKQISTSLTALARHTSGGRLRFKTDSTTIGISVKYPSLLSMVHMPLTGSCGFALLEKIGDTYKTVSVFRPNPDEKEGYSGEVKIKTEGVHEYVMFFPLYNRVSELKIYLDKNATLYEPEKYRDIAPILYYGASIDQGGCASRPDSCFTSMLCKWTDIDFINLCFSGNCKGEQSMAEYMTGIDCSLFFMAYDGNAPDVEYLEQTHYPFYETYRKARKDVPIVFMSVPCFEGFRNAAERRDVIYRSYLKARENGDNNVYFIDGETLFGEKDREVCTVEGIHPNDLGFYRIAEKIKQFFDENGLCK